MSTETEELRDEVGLLKTDLDLMWGRIQALGDIVINLDAALAKHAPAARTELIARLRKLNAGQDGVSGYEDQARYLRDLFDDL